MAGNPFVGNPGEFDEENPPVVEPAANEDPAVDLGWQAPRVKRIVRAQGVATHELIGVGQEDWLWRASELDALAEPLAEMLNRYPVTQAAALVSDELTVGAVMLEYSLRSIRERSRVLKARKAAEQAAEQARRTGPSAPLAGPRAFDTGVTPDDVGAQPAVPVNPMNAQPEQENPAMGDNPQIWRVPE